ncbi:MAG: hypothetical protein AB7W47_01480 [Calditrichaceae bacterium]
MINFMKTTGNKMAHHKSVLKTNKDREIIPIIIEGKKLNMVTFSCRMKLNVSDTPPKIIIDFH